jgi:hypothetical protein
MLWPAERCGSRYAAEFSAVRQRCERSTDSWWPWVYVLRGVSGLIMPRTLAK